MVVFNLRFAIEPNQQLVMTERQKDDVIWCVMCDVWCVMWCNPFPGVMREKREGRQWVGLSWWWPPHTGYLSACNSGIIISSVSSCRNTPVSSSQSPHLISPHISPLTTNMINLTCLLSSQSRTSYSWADCDRVTYLEPVSGVGGPGLPVPDWGGQTLAHHS